MKTFSIFINSLKLFLVDIKTYIFVFLIAPLVFSFMYGTIYKNILNPNRTIEKFTVAYVDLDQSRESKPLESIFNEGKLNKIVSLEKLSSTKDLNDDLLHGTYTSAIIIPKNFSQNIETNKRASIKVLQSPSAGVNGEIISDIVDSYCSYLNMNRSVYSVIMTSSKNQALTEKIFTSMLPEIETDLNSTYLTYTSLPKAKLLNSKQLFSSNMLIMCSLFIVLVQAISIIKESEFGTLNRIYSTATSKLCFYFGKLLGTFVISIVQILCFLVVSTLFIGVNFGNYFTLIPIILVHSLIIAAFTAVLISIFKNTSLMSGLFSIIIFMMSSVSGTFYPADFNTGFMKNVPHFTINYWINNLYSSNMFGDAFSSMLGVICIALVICSLAISFGAIKLKYEY